MYLQIVLNVCVQMIHVAIRQCTPMSQVRVPVVFVGVFVHLSCSVGKFGGVPYKRHPSEGSLLSGS